MIISVSRRTDVPALSSGWFVQCLESGRVLVANPMNPKQTREIPLSPDDVYVFWTRNPTPLLPEQEKWENRGLKTLWLITLTGYPKILEPGAPLISEVLDAVKKLSAIVGPERVIWRYDPIFTSEKIGLGIEAHRALFAGLAGSLTKYVGGARTSVYDPYRKAERRLSRAGIVHDGALAGEAARAIAEEAAKRGLKLTSCVEDLMTAGIEPGPCIDGSLIKKLWGLDYSGEVDKNQRKGCLCAPSTDIGSYGRCPHGCLYCYASHG